MNKKRNPTFNSLFIRKGIPITQMLHHAAGYWMQYRLPACQWQHRIRRVQYETKVWIILSGKQFWYRHRILEDQSCYVDIGVQPEQCCYFCECVIREYHLLLFCAWLYNYDPHLGISKIASTTQQLLGVVDPLLSHNSLQPS